jgi:hypothetical protein
MRRSNASVPNEFALDVVTFVSGRSVVRIVEHRPWKMEVRGSSSSQGNYFHANLAFFINVT